MTTDVAIEFCWTGEVMQPITGWWTRRAARQFTVGEVYTLANQPERSLRSHNHYFASVAEAWKNLPDQMAERFPTPDHLRRYALIKAGYCNSQSMPCPSEAAALRFAAFIRPIDEFALVTVDNCVVNLFSAKSQSIKAMGRQDFQKSKDKTLDIIADMIGVTKKELESSHKAQNLQPTAADYLAAG